MNRKVACAVGALTFTLAIAGVLLFALQDQRNPSEASPQTQASLCAEHGVAGERCPFCHPELVEELGICQEHKVPEALCYQCRPDLVAGFKATHDWCAEHEVPESQCPL